MADWLENQFQHFFLSDPRLTTIVDPLPLISTLASNLKWLLVAASLSLIVAWASRAVRLKVSLADRHSSG